MQYCVAENVDYKTVLHNIVCDHEHFMLSLTMTLLH